MKETKQVQANSKVSKLLNAVLQNVVGDKVSSKTLSYSTDPQR